MIYLAVPIAGIRLVTSRRFDQSVAMVTFEEVDGVMLAAPEEFEVGQRLNIKRRLVRGPKGDYWRIIKV